MSRARSSAPPRSTASIDLSRSRNCVTGPGRGRSAPFRRTRQGAPGATCPPPAYHFRLYNGRAGCRARATGQDKLPAFQGIPLTNPVKSEKRTVKC